MPLEPASKRRALNVETLVSLGALLIVWQVASYFLPEYVLPGIQLIFQQFAEMAHGGTLFWDTLMTLDRIVRGLIVGFIMGALFGALMGTIKKTEPYVMPIVNFIMGVPALSWTLIVILWFSGTETRILVLMVAISFPVFAHSILDAIKGVSKEWMEMTLVFRPTRAQVLRMLILPAIIPHVLTSWKVAVGFAVRVVIVAELVGASSGVGYRMLQQQALFNMSGVLAWTLVLVVSGLAMQFLISVVESRLLRWRPSIP
jgi:NitT/TauT family transport system permease protein